MTSNASNLVVDIREDEEQYQRLQDCVDVLLASGYFRARIKGLSAFDKIVGGMTWCLSICNFSVDVNLLYSESATIGQKIALTEKIVSVLSQLQCPHPLEPHQIQGLDFRHIFPVIQWLVKKAIETKKEHGDEITAFCDYVVEGPSSEKQENLSYKKFQDFVASTAPQRVRRRGPNTKPPTLQQDVACTIAEFTSATGSAAAVDYEEDELTESLEESNLRDRVSKTRFKNMLDAVATQSSEPVDGVAELKRKIEMVQGKTRTMKEAMERIKSEREVDDEEDRQKREEEATKADILSKYSESEIEEVRQLIEDYGKAVQREKSFKTSCRAEMAGWEEEIEQLQNFNELSDENKTAAEKELEKEVAEIETRMPGKRRELAEVTQEVSALQRQLDSIPSQLEMTQYQQRFIELYNQMASKHRQTKQYITLHNTLIDVHTFMKKEIGVLNKIEEVLPQVAKEANQDAFVHSLHEILKGVETGHEKLKSRNGDLERRKNDLSMELAQLRDNESRFHLVSEEFKEACQKNEELLAQLHT